MEGPTTRRWHTREDSGIRLDRQLRWWHDDEPVEHPNIIEIFNRSLVPAEDGKFKLIIGNDWCFVQVEDAAYAVLAIDTVDDALSLRLSDRTAERLDPASLTIDPDGVLACKVKEGRAKARFARDAQFAIGSLFEEDTGGLTLRIGAKRVPLSPELVLTACDAST